MNTRDRYSEDRVKLTVKLPRRQLKFLLHAALDRRTTIEEELIKCLDRTTVNQLKEKG